MNAVEARPAIFTPLIVSVDGVLGCEARLFLYHLRNYIADMWKKSHSEVMAQDVLCIRATNSAIGTLESSEESDGH